jgi:hypothetical protein
VCLEKRVNSAGDPVAARVGLRNAMTGGMAPIAIRQRRHRRGHRRGLDGPPGDRVFRDGLRSGPALCLGTPAGAVGSFARASRSGFRHRQRLHLGGSCGVAGGAIAFALGGRRHADNDCVRCGGGERATLGSGGARKYGCDQTGCGGLSVLDQPASLIGALNSPHDKSADKRQSMRGAVCTSSISYSEVARWLSAFRTYGSRSNL